LDFKDVVNSRRSIRTYIDKDISDELIYKILEYGHSAPSAGNIQPWEFIIVKSEEIKNKIVDTTFIGNNENGIKKQDWMLSAPVFIVICGNKKKSYDRYGKKALETLIYLDVSACIENMILGAVDLGLASCYVSGFREKDLSRVLNLPETHEVIGILPIGYSSEVCFSRPKIDLNEIIHHEQFKVYK
jgi:nitroreductase